LKTGAVLLLSSVRKDLTNIVLEQKGRLTIYIPKYDNLGGITLDYDTPETLGIDRVLACAGGVRLSGSDVVVVDAGTACTVDFMAADYTFNGGVILPGLPMLRHSMKTLTPELPEVETDIPARFPGKSTKDAIRIGLNGGFIYSITQFIKQYIELDSSVQILITGGDGPFVQEHIRQIFNSTFHENLVFDGMLAWKDLNKI
jgi:type III pantothenate kinase